MSSLKSKIVIILLPVFMSAQVVPAYANDVDTKVEKLVTDLQKGQKAPFDGILMTQKLAAEVKENCSKDVIEKRCDARVKEAVGLAQSECTATTSVLNSKVSACQLKYDESIAAKDKEIESLKVKLDKMEPHWYDSPELWLGIGVVLGGGAVYGIVKAVK